MSILAIITLLRLIPYGVVLVFALRKGFKWLAFTMVWLFVVLAINFFESPTEEQRGLLSSVFGVLLMLHVFDLKTRRSK